MRFRVFDIRYDTDGHDIDLPTVLEIELEDHEYVEDELSEAISSITGFCHFGFDYIVLDEEPAWEYFSD